MPQEPSTVADSREPGDSKPEGAPSARDLAAPRTRPRMVRSARRMGGLAAAFVVVALPLVLYIGSATPDASSPELVGRGGDGARERRVQDSTSNEIGASCLLVETEYDANGDAVEVISHLPEGAGFGNCPENGVLPDRLTCKPECNGAWPRPPPLAPLPFHRAAVALSRRAAIYSPAHRRVPPRSTRPPARPRTRVAPGCVRRVGIARRVPLRRRIPSQTVRRMRSLPTT